MRRAVLLLSLFLLFCGPGLTKQFKEALANGDFSRAYSLLLRAEDGQEKKLMRAQFISSLKAALPKFPIQELLKMSEDFSKDREISLLFRSELKGRFPLLLKEGKFLLAGDVLKTLGKDSELQTQLISALYARYFPEEKGGLPEISPNPQPLLSVFPDENCIIKYSTKKGEVEAWYKVKEGLVRIVARKATEEETTRLSFALLFAHSIDLEMNWYGADKGLISQLAGVNYFTFKHAGGYGIFMWEADKNSASATYAKGGRIFFILIPRCSAQQAKTAFIKVFGKLRLEKI